MSYFLCSVCGYINFDSAPESCPVCMSPKDKFSQNNDIFKESAEKSPEAAVKHVPVVWVAEGEKLWDGAQYINLKVKIGEVAHPMEEKHFITFIDVYADKKWVKRIHNSPAVYAAGAAHLKGDVKTVQVIENCNIHGWWMTEKTL
jgi:superoxide reductase